MHHSIFFWIVSWVSLTRHQLLLDLHLLLSRSEWPLVRQGASNPFLPFDFVFRFSQDVAKLRSCPLRDIIPPTRLLSFSLLALFLVRLSCQALLTLIHTQTALTLQQSCIKFRINCYSRINSTTGKYCLMSSIWMLGALRIVFTESILLTTLYSVLKRTTGKSVTTFKDLSTESKRDLSVFNFQLIVIGGSTLYSIMTQQQYFICTLYRLHFLQ